VKIYGVAAFRVREKWARCSWEGDN